MNLFKIFSFFSFFLMNTVDSISVNSIYMDKYQKYIHKYNKDFSYGNFFIFKNNMEYIEQFNDNLFEVEVNQFVDVNLLENNLIKKRKHQLYENTSDMFDIEIPDSVNWVEKNVVTKVKNQGQCGSCYAFSATGSMEGIYAIKNNHLRNISEQEIVDCSGNEGNQGCFGGYMNQVFQYVIDNDGICSEQEYPYNALQNQCNDKCQNIVQISSYQNVTQNNETILMNAVAQQPVSVAIQANLPSFQFYSKGIYNDSQCTDELDHGVLVVGYGEDDNNVSYWLVKNSWGPNWGENGYIRILRNLTNNTSGMCGIAMEPSFPII